MKKFGAVTLSIWLGFTGTAFAEGSDCSGKVDTPKRLDTDRPVLVLLETDPWAMVLGAESPRFALYGNGLAIYRTADGFRQILLDRKRASDLQNSVNVGALACLKEHYSTSNSTDQPSEYLLFGRGGRLSKVSVYGRIHSDGEPTNLPASFVAAYDRLVKFEDSNARPWMPDFIEVMVWPYEYAPEPSIKWPSKWPGLADPTTVKRRDAFSLYVPSKDYEELRAFLQTQHEKGAVEIGGKKWAVSLRFPFPQESSWQSKLRESE
jgi:hypothetical protein